MLQRVDGIYLRRSGCVDVGWTNKNADSITTYCLPLLDMHLKPRNNRTWSTVPPGTQQRPQIAYLANHNTNQMQASPNITTPPAPKPSNILNLLQLNINRFRDKSMELQDFMFKNNIYIADLQQTKLDHNRKTPTFRNYTIIRHDKNNHGGGLVLLIHSTI